MSASMLAWPGAVAIGINLGLLDSGGSIVTVPVLIYLFGQDEKVAIAGSLGIAGSIALAGSIPYIRAGLIDWRNVVIFGLPGMIGTYLGAWSAVLISGLIQFTLFAMVMLIASYFMLKPMQLEASAPSTRKVWKIGIDGLLVGVLPGLVGVGGGFLIVPALVLLGGLPMHRAVATSPVIIEPSDRHYYQSGYTLAGAGVFKTPQLSREMQDVMPERVRWIRAAAAAFDPDKNQVILEDASRVNYQQLVVAPGLKLDWEQIDGLAETLGTNGVTSNYRNDLTSYTWELVQELKSGRALFTQPPMPIKCAGAPQKAMYLSCDHWLRQSCLDQIDVEFYTAGGVLFGVEAYVPALMEYVKKYNAQLSFCRNLVAIDGPDRTAWFEGPGEDGQPTQIEKSFDMIHVCPPQTAPDVVSNSPLADANGWVDVNQATLRHVRYDNRLVQ